MSSAIESAEQFLRLVLPETSEHEAYRAEFFDAPKDSPRLWSAYNDIEKLARDILAAGQMGNAFFSPVTFEQRKSRQAEYARRCRVVWADLDVCVPNEKTHGAHHHASIAEAHAVADAFALKPHVQLLTGHGLLLIWRLVEPVEGEELARLIRVVRGLARKLPSDPNVALLTQLLRCPGTKNFDPKRKKDGRTHPVRLHQFNPDLHRYTLDDFADAGVPEVEAKSKERGAQGTLTLGGGAIVETPSISPRMKDLLATPGRGEYPSPSEADAAVMTAMLGAGLSPADVLATFSASPRGADAAMRKGSHLDDYLDRTLRSAQAKVTDDQARQAKEHLASVAGASNNGIGPSRSAPIVPHGFPEDAWHGVFAQYRDAAATTEAPPHHHFATLSAVVGAALGRRIYVVYERPTYPNRYVVLVGKTGAVRKTGTMRRGTDAIRRADPTLPTLTGVGSAEGLAERLATAGMTDEQRKRYQKHVDGEKDESGDVPPVPLPPAMGRRLLLTLEEFAALLSKARGEGTGNLLPLLTQLYDCPDTLDHPLRSKSIIALAPTLSVLTASAPTWIERYVMPSELLSGFCNRFEFWPGDPTEAVPWPEAPREGPLNAVVARLHEALGRWGDSRGKQIQFTLSREAQSAWTGYYTTFRSRLATYDDQRAAVVQRAPTFAVKMALTFAALECNDPIIGAEHIERSTMIADYLEAGAGELLGGLGVSEEVKLQTKIVERLQQKPRKRRDVQQSLSGRVGAPAFNRVWEALVTSKVIRCDAREVWRVAEEDE